MANNGSYKSYKYKSDDMEFKAYEHFPFSFLRLDVDEHSLLGKNDVIPLGKKLIDIVEEYITSRTFNIIDEGNKLGIFKDEVRYATIYVDCDYYTSEIKSLKDAKTVANELISLFENNVPSIPTKMNCAGTYDIVGNDGCIAKFKSMDERNEYYNLKYTNKYNQKIVKGTRSWVLHAEDSTCETIILHECGGFDILYHIREFIMEEL